MEKEKILEDIRAHYPRDLRKQLIKTILMQEKEKNIAALKESYGLIDQIFSYVLKACDWSMADNSKEWDHTPLEIMDEAFPKLSETKWYKDQLLFAKHAIDVVGEKQ